MGSTNGLTRYFIDAVSVASAFEVGFKKGFYDLLRLLGSNEAGWDTNHVGIVVLTCQRGNLMCPAERSAYALMLVRSYGNAVGASADQDARPINLAFYSFGNRVCEVGVIDRLAIVRTEVGYRIAKLFDVIF